MSLLDEFVRNNILQQSEIISVNKEISSTSKTLDQVLLSIDISAKDI
jgi:hypothetical protein